MSTAQELSSKRKALLDDLRANPTGLAWCERHTDLVDEAVRVAYAGLLTKLERVPQFAVVATGGYGRRELAPWSDVDITFVPLDESDPDLDKAIKSLFRDLHDLVADGLGIRLGYALRYPSDCPGLDPKTRSGLLDARVVTGSQEAHEALQKAFWDSFPTAAFVIDKIDEQVTYLRAIAEESPWKAFWILVLAGFAPIPLKFFTWASGIVGVPLVPFMASMFVGRGKRVYLLAGAIRLGGPRAAAAVHRWIEPLGWIAVSLLVVVAGYLVWRAQGG